MWLSWVGACAPSALIPATTPPDSTSSPTADTSTFPTFEEEPPRNVLMISIDTLRFDSVGPATTPFLQGLADEGVWFTDHTQCSNWTYPSTSCTLNGQYSEDNGFIPQISSAGRAPMPDGQQTLAVRLKELGYDTTLLSSNGWLSAEWNNSQGYDETPEAGETAEATLRAAIDHLSQRATSAPWFVHVHVKEPHAPYDPPAPYLEAEAALPPIPWDLTTSEAHYATTDLWPDLPPEDQDLLEQHLRVRYAGEIRYLDDQLASVWPELLQGGWLDDTLVVIWSDHGEQFWERGHQSHAWDLGPEENQGVLLLWARNVEPMVWTAPTSAVDLLPTVLSVTDHPGVSAATDPLLSGYPVGEAPADRPRFAMAVARSGAVQSIEQDGWKLQFRFAGTVALFDRTTDPGERVDLYDPTHPRVLPLWTALAPRIQRMSELVPAAPLVWPEDLPRP